MTPHSSQYFSHSWSSSSRIFGSFSARSSVSPGSFERSYSCQAEVPFGKGRKSAFHCPLRIAERPQSSQPKDEFGSWTVDLAPRNQGIILLPSIGTTGLPWYIGDGCVRPASSSSVGAISITVANVSVIGSTDLSLCR